MQPPDPYAAYILDLCLAGTAVIWCDSPDLQAAKPLPNKLLIPFSTGRPCAKQE